MRFRRVTPSAWGSIFTARFDSGQDISKWRRLPLMRADADPANAAVTADDEQRAPCKIECIHTQGLIDTVGARYVSFFVEEDRERIFVFMDVLLAPEQPIDLLPGDEHHACVSRLEFVISRLE